MLLAAFLLGIGAGWWFWGALGGQFAVLRRRLEALEAENRALRARSGDGPTDVEDQSPSPPESPVSDRTERIATSPVNMR